jgi:hypothetical protein
VFFVLDRPTRKEVRRTLAADLPLDFAANAAKRVFRSKIPSA